jgi:hypothetical protein
MSQESRLNPTVSMWDWIVDDLRFFLKKSDMTGAALAEVLSRDPSSVYNLLDGRRRLQLRDAEILDKLWDLNEKFTRQVLYARQRSSKEWFGEYVGYEASASVVKTFAAITVPGLLQTPEYATAVTEVGGWADVEGQVQRRMDRQKIFDRSKPPTLWALITESVLDWPMGGRKVMCAQLAHLIEMAQRPNVGIRVVPRSTGAHIGVDGSFSIIYGESDVAYTESPGGGRLVLSAPEVLEFSNRYDRIGQVALPAQSSLALIQQWMESYK